MGRILKACLLGLLLICASWNNEVLAKHILGGHMSYKEETRTATDITYSVTIKVYRDASSGGATLPNSVTGGIYVDTNNPNQKKLFQTMGFTLDGQPKEITLSKPANCNFVQPIRVQEGTYLGSITVPFSSTLSTNGFYLVYSVCCRNDQIVNLELSQASCFYAYIPPSDISNSSAYYTEPPLPFICVGDTSVISNAAIDDDGDVLRYKFIVPDNGYTSSGQAGGNPPNTLPFPITKCLYKTTDTYSENNIFGSIGKSRIDTITGETTFYPGNPASLPQFYVFAVEISEYRNGKLVGVTRRDVQVLVVDCGTAAAPDYTSVNGSGQKVFNVEGGDQVCFPVTFSDPKGSDSIYVSFKGDLFDPIKVSPTATYTGNKKGVGSVTNNICWTTACDQINDQPYIFSAIGKNNACPPRTATVGVQIYVKRPEPTITGVQTVCPKKKSASYNISSPNAGSTFAWTVTGGTGSSTAGPSISVDWNTTTGGKVEVIETNRFGCKSKIIAYPVNVDSVITISAGTPQDVCPNDSTAKLGPSPVVPGTYQWTPNVNISSVTSTSPRVAGANTTPNDLVQDYQLLVRTPEACVSKETVRVTIHPLPTVTAGSATSGCANSNIQVGGPSKTGYTYTWSPTNGVVGVNSSNPFINLPNNTAGPLSYKYFVEASTQYMCKKKDSVTVTVNPGPKIIPLFAANSKDSICPGTTVSLVATGGNTYIWKNKGVVIGTGPTISVSPNATQYYSVTGTDGSSCTSSDSILVHVRALPTLTISPATAKVCLNDTAKLSATGAKNYVWAIVTAGNTQSTTDKLNFRVNADTDVFLKGTDKFGCVNNTTMKVQKINLPNVNAVSTLKNRDKDTICANDNLLVSVTGANSYVWFKTNDPGTTVSTLDNFVISGSLTFQLVARGFDGVCYKNDTVFVQVRKLPNVAIVPNEDSICYGKTLILNAAGANSYKWSKQPNTSTVISTINNYTETANASTTFVLKGTDTFGCTNTTTRAIYVRPLPVVVANTDANNICPGKQVKLTVKGAKTYEWKLLDSVSTYSTDSLFFDKPAVTTSYEVKGTNQFGCVKKDVVVVKVNPKPQPLTIVGNPYACPGVANSIYSIVDTTKGASIYRWYITGGTPKVVPNSDTASINWGAIGTGTVKLVEVNRYNCLGDTNYITVSIKDKLTPPAPLGVNVLCKSTASNISYNIGAPNASSVYTWFAQGGTITSGQNTTGVTVTWNTIGDKAGKVWFEEKSTTALANCLGLSDTTYVTINPSPITNVILGDSTVCVGDNNKSYILAGLLGSTYQWTISNGETFSGNGRTTIAVNWLNVGTRKITVQETTDKGCLGKLLTMNVIVNPLPIAKAVLGADTVCNLSLANNVYKAQATNGFSYLWTVGGGKINSGQGTQQINVTWDRDATAYSVGFTPISKDSCVGFPLSKQVIGDFSMANVNLATTKFDADSIIDLTWDLSYKGGKLNNYRLYRRAKGTVAYTILGDLKTNSYTDKSPTLKTDKFAYEYKYAILDQCGDTSKSKIHNTMLLNGSGDQSTQNISLVWNPYINWRYGLQRYEIWRKLDDEPNYKLMTAVGSDTSAVLNLGADGFKHVYRVKAVESSTGEVSWSNERVIYFDHKINIPSAFSPNGDGVNDTWVIRNIDAYKQSVLEIFNRWGEKVYESRGYNNDWKGTVDGQALPDGTYFYVLKLHSSAKDSKDSYTGTVTLVK